MNMKNGCNSRHTTGCLIGTAVGDALGLPYDNVIMSPSKRPFKIADKGTPITTLFA